MAKIRKIRGLANCCAFGFGAALSPAFSFNYDFTKIVIISRKLMKIMNYKSSLRDEKFTLTTPLLPNQ